MVRKPDQGVIGYNTLCLSLVSRDTPLLILNSGSSDYIICICKDGEAIVSFD